jgi:hypothetical protein
VLLAGRECLALWIAGAPAYPEGVAFELVM